MSACVVIHLIRIVKVSTVFFPVCLQSVITESYNILPSEHFLWILEFPLCNTVTKYTFRSITRYRFNLLSWHMYIFLCYVDVDECLQTNDHGQVQSPCDETNSFCVNQDPFFACQCREPWIPDTDGLGCSRKCHTITKSSADLGNVLALCLRLSYSRKPYTYAL